MRMARLTIHPMAAGTQQDEELPGKILDLLPLMSSRPDGAMARPPEILANDPAPFDASVAHQIMGIVLREWGDLDAGTRELRAALRLARVARSPDRQPGRPRPPG